ncbi:murein L,D-transpeptidase catalytic domain-containing protein [Sphingomonas ginsengisoli (ex An et al. 2013)]|nr:murein L,D-transpeptidase catalytic domain family protein [Sphingomonas ginsengisoli An et al. 2013]
MDSLEKHGCRPGPRAEVMVVDFALPSGTPRSWLVNVVTGAGQDVPFIVAHGQGSDPDQKGRAVFFGNIHDSQMSSLGAFVGGRDAKTDAHPDAVVLYGLDGPLNDQARSRFIYLHSTFNESPDYVSDEYIEGNGHKAGRSCGCFVVQRDAFIRRLKPAVSNGGFIYAGYSGSIDTHHRFYPGPRRECGTNIDRRSASTNRLRREIRDRPIGVAGSEEGKRSKRGSDEAPGGAP